MNVRQELNLIRTPGLWDLSRQGHEQLALDVAAPALSVALVSATGRLQITPDFDILAWLSERWMAGRPPDPDGWASFTVRELLRDLHGPRASSSGRQVVRSSLLRLMTTVFSIQGYDARERRQLSGREQQRRAIATMSAAVIAVQDEGREALSAADALVHVAGRTHISPELARRFGAVRRPTCHVQLAPWLTGQLLAGGYTILDFQVLRRLDGLAKRLWCYLEAEQLHPTSDPEIEEIKPVGLGRPALNTLGAGAYARHRDARAALGRAGRRICEADPRWQDIFVHRRSAHSHQLRAARLTRAAARERASEARERAERQEQVRREILGSLNSASGPPGLRSGGGAGGLAA